MAKTKSYVYIMRCKGFYKIGVSKDPERRVRELDKRPYKVELIFVSSATEYAYKVEKFIQEWLEYFKVGGEWYDFPHSMVEVICDEIVYEITNWRDLFDEA